MVRGFYQLGAGMLNANQTLANISSNVSNIKTPGYKRKEMVTSTFADTLMARMDGRRTIIGSSAFSTRVDENLTIHSQGSIDETGRNLDFGLVGAGFFGIETGEGIRYTRQGSFDLNEEGYLILPGSGYVLGQDGERIQLNTDQVTADDWGNISGNAGLLGSVGVYDFADYNALEVVGEGFFTGEGATAVEQPTVRWRALEGSNVDMTAEMTNAISTQRMLQSASQILKMYDQVLSRSVTEIGKV